MYSMCDLLKIHVNYITCVHNCFKSFLDNTGAVWHSRISYSRVDNKKNIENHQRYPLTKKKSNTTVSPDNKKQKAKKTSKKKKKHITAGRALGAKVICQPGSWQFSPLMNVQHPPLTRTLEEGGNRPTLNTWDSRDAFSALYKTFSTPVYVA